MLAYTAGSRRIAARSSNPNAMLIVIGVHVAAVAILMSAKMDLPIRPHFDGTDITFVPFKPDPVPVDPVKPIVPQATQPTDNHVDRTPPLVQLGQQKDLGLDTGTKVVELTDLGTGGTLVIPEIHETLPPNPVKSAPRLLTSGADLKPPYPAMKLLNEEEGAVTVKLTIDDTGHVVAVDPVGRADPAFLASARKHLIAHWRFKPASEDGRAISSTTVVTLHFELNG